jgi:ATP-dependent 26S proteasome regulatory subunit
MMGEVILNVTQKTLRDIHSHSAVQYEFYAFQGMIALRRSATAVTHEDFMDAILEVQAKKKANLNYYA